MLLTFKGTTLAKSDKIIFADIYYANDGLEILSSIYDSIREMFQCFTCFSGVLSEKNIIKTSESCFVDKSNQHKMVICPYIWK